MQYLCSVEEEQKQPIINPSSKIHELSSGGDFRIQNSQFRITNMITYKVSKVKNPGKNAVEGTQYFAAKVLLKNKHFCVIPQREGSLTNVRDDIKL